MLLGNQPASPALVAGMLPPIGSSISRPSDCADDLGAAETLDDCCRRFHGGNTSVFPKIMSSTIQEIPDSSDVLENRNSGSMNDELIAWLKRGLQNPAKSKGGIAAALGRSASTVTDILKGERAIKLDEIGRIAAYLELPPPALPGVSLRVLPEIQAATEGNLFPVTVAGPVQAGAFLPIDEYDQSAPETFFEPADPEFPRARRTAFDVIGDSMNQLAPIPILPGSRLIAVNYEDIGIPLRDRMVVVVQQERESGFLREWSVKQVELQDDVILFHPRSSNPRHKPIIVSRDLQADDGKTVTVLALVREIKNKVPVF